MFANRRLERKINALNFKLDLVLNHLGIQDLAAAEPISAAATTVSPAPGGLAEIDALLAEGKKIHAVKRYRELTGCGLREAKEAVERRYPY